MFAHAFSALPAWVECDARGFGEGCILRLSDDANAAGMAGRLKLKIARHGGQDVVHRVDIALACESGRVHIHLGHDDANVSFGRGTRGAFNLHLWRTSNVVVGAHTSGNGARIVCDDSDFECGEDCMFSDDVLVQTADQHGIVDVETGRIVNEGRKRTVLGRHVWLGRGSAVLPGVRIGDGAIVGMRSVVTADVPALSIVAGVPARVVGQGRTWSRRPNRLEEWEEAMLAEWRAGQAGALP
ncbi:acyltransferase [Lysobacter sp. KIS68-7]|uniref:acyltransferase n=1 Tax=Lysobacter sp. KIS68-7 TaxID=2904252 RepID=UPI00272EA1A5|nr:acyltransferase [Lysobacter sp. KIS68-7]